MVAARAEQFLDATVFLLQDEMSERKSNIKPFDGNPADFDNWRRDMKDVIARHPRILDPKKPADATTICALIRENVTENVKQVLRTLNEKSDNDVEKLQQFMKKTYAKKTTQQLFEIIRGAMTIQQNEGEDLITYVTRTEGKLRELASRGIDFIQDTTDDEYEDAEEADEESKEMTQGEALKAMGGYILQNGLRDHNIKKQLITDGIVTWEDTTERLKHIARTDADGEWQNDNEKNTKTNSTYYSSNNRFGRSSRGGSMQQQQQHQQQRTNYRGQPGLCFKCGKPGHTWRECRSTGQQQQQYGRGMGRVNYGQRREYNSSNPAVRFAFNKRGGYNNSRGGYRGSIGYNSDRNYNSDGRYNNNNYSSNYNNSYSNSSGRGGFGGRGRGRGFSGGNRNGAYFFDQEDVMLGCLAACGGEKDQLMTQKVVIHVPGATTSAVNRATLDKYNITYRQTSYLQSMTKTAGGDALLVGTAEIQLYVPTADGRQFPMKLQNVALIDSPGQVPLLFGLDVIEKYGNRVVMDYGSS